MKALALAVLLLASTAWAGDMNAPYNQPRMPFLIIENEDAISGVTNKQANDQRRELIVKWAASGEICRVIAHRWKAIPIDPQWFREQRRCTICGKVETKEEVWK